jgi:predicted GIY-YIG superfamily endonuclease
MEEQYLYIVQAEREKDKCKIGITANLENRLKQYDSRVGQSVVTDYNYLFTCQVSHMKELENAIKKEYGHLREQSNTEIYFYNEGLFEGYVNFIKASPLFVKELFIKPSDKAEAVVKIVSKTTPSLDERGLSRIQLMHNAKRVNNDEFYTRYEDIEKELTNYDKVIWQDKIVFCNCDDAVDNNEKRTSAFALYFLQNFHKLSLKKLICTHYSGGVDLFNAGAKGYVFTYTFTQEGFEEKKSYPSGFTGSFDHPLSLKILNEEADIVVTNPPFSRAIDYWRIVIGSGKQFIIVSNIINPISTWCISYFREGEVWAGYNRVDWFENSKRQLADAAAHWYTNVPISNRPRARLLKIIPLNEIPDNCKQFDDNSILLVDKGYIPSNYPYPFAISARPILNGLLEQGYEIVNDKQYDPPINGKIGFKRVLVQKIKE